MTHFRTLLALTVIGLCCSSSFVTPSIAQSLERSISRARRKVEPPPVLAFVLSDVRPTAFLERVWPDYPEALATFLEIALDKGLSRETGWFKKAIAETRFDWAYVTERYDRNHDRKIERDEYSGSTTDFERLDRDLNGVLTWTDITPLSNDPRANQLADVFGFESFLFCDRSVNQQADMLEVERFLEQSKKPGHYFHILKSVYGQLEKRYERATREGKAFLTLADFQEVFDIAALFGTMPKAPINAPINIRVRKEVLLGAFFRRELGHWNAGPSLDEPAPDFTLKTSDGKTGVTLSKSHDSKPVVLIFGNVTCGGLRNHRPSLELLLADYKDRANFLMIYTRESHPTNGWDIDLNHPSRVDLLQPRDYAERVNAANTCSRIVPLDLPVLVDTIDDQVSRAYSAMPIRLYLIDRQGKIAYKSGRGIYGFKPAELEKALILLGESERTETSPSAAHASPK
jgi:thiol-disulfide isomerase/thioredoxin